MKKVLVILLCLFAMMGMLTTASVSSQRNAWKKEAEQAQRDLKKLEEKYEKYQEEMEEKYHALETERDAFALVGQAMEQENTSLKAQVEALQQSLVASDGLEAQLTQANADREWAEKRLQDALDILLTPLPSPSPAPQTEATPDPLSLLPEIDWAPVTDSIREMLILSIPIPEEAAEPLAPPSPDEILESSFILESTPAPSDTSENMAEEQETGF